MRKKRRTWAGGFLALCMAIGLFGGIPAAAETAQEEWFKSHPTSDRFDSLWVGDVVVFESQGYDDWGDGGPAPGNTMTIVSGDCVEFTDNQYMGEEDWGEFWKGLKFTKPGKAQVKIKETKKDTGASREKTFSFTVTQRPADKPVKATYRSFGNKKVKIGEQGDCFNDIHIDVVFHNVNYGQEELDFIDSTGDDVFDTFYYDGGKGGGMFPLVGNDRTQVSAETLWLHSGAYAYRPGTESLSASCSGRGNLGTLGTITVEEPVITTNAPASIKVGGTLNLTTALTNTVLKNLKTAEYEDKKNYDDTGEVGYGKGSYYKYEERGNNPVAYKPSVTVIEGKDCVVQSKQDYSHTLSSSETLTFKKAGTVKLKVTYTQFATSPKLLYSWEWDEGKQESIRYKDDKRYHPEKIITIQVTEDGQPAQPPKGTTASSNNTGTKPPTGSASVSTNSVPGNTSSGETTAPTGDPTLPPVEEQPVIFTDEETGVKLGAAEGVLPPDTALVVKPSNFVLEDAAGKFTAFDISLENGGAKIQPNGRVQVSIPIPAGYDKERLTIYHIADGGTKTELPCAVAGDAVTFETDHFSLYVLAEKAAVQAADGAPQPDGNTSKPGGSPVGWIVLAVVLLAAAGGGFALWWFKFRKKSGAEA